jgi:hypothetical protein
MGKRELKQDIVAVEELVRQHVRAIEGLTNQHNGLLAEYHGVREGTWVTGTSSTGNVWYGPVVAIDWTDASTKVQPAVKIRAYNPVSGNVGMRFRVLHSWKLAKAPKVAA